MCFDFDHIDQTLKLNDISRVVNDNSPFNRLVEEIEKCQLLCCFCHRIKTSKQLSYNYDFKINNETVTFPINKCKTCNNDTGDKQLVICVNCEL